MRGIDAALTEWERAGLVTAKAAQKIRAYEAKVAPAAGGPTEPASRRSAVSEVLGYLGAALAISAVAVIVAAQWQGFSFVSRVVVVGLMTVVVASAGIAMRGSTRPATSRLASVLMTAGVWGVTWLVGVIADDGLHLAPQPTLLAVGGAATAASLLLYLSRKRALPHLTLLVALLILATGLVGEAGRDNFDWTTLAWASVSVLWFGASARRLLTPYPLGMVAGASAALLALQIGSFGSSRLAMLSAGVVLALGLAVLSVVQRGAIAVLAPGAVGLLFFAPQLISEIFADSFATWIAVLVTGLVLVVAAVTITRGRGATPEDR